jgi:hypothetical protein
MLLIRRAFHPPTNPHIPTWWQKIKKERKNHAPRVAFCACCSLDLSGSCSTSIVPPRPTETDPAGLPILSSSIPSTYCVPNKHFCFCATAGGPSRTADNHAGAAASLRRPTASEEDGKLLPPQSLWESPEHSTPHN